MLSFASGNRGFYVNCLSKTTHYQPTASRARPGAARYHVNHLGAKSGNAFGLGSKGSTVSAKRRTRVDMSAIVCRQMEDRDSDRLTKGRRRNIERDLPSTDTMRSSLSGMYPRSVWVVWQLSFRRLRTELRRSFPIRASYFIHKCFCDRPYCMQ